MDTKHLSMEGLTKLKKLNEYQQQHIRPSTGGQLPMENITIYVQIKKGI